MSTETLTSNRSSLFMTAPRAVPLDILLQPIDLDPSPYAESLRRYRDNLSDVAQSKSLRSELSTLRSTIPALRQFSRILYHYGRHFWLVYLDTLTTNSMIPIPLYVGQRPIHISHGEAELSGRMMDIAELPDIDPSLVIADSDLRLIQRQFRHAYGVRIHSWGFVDILFRTPEEVWLQRKLPMPARVGSLGFNFVVTEHLPTSRLPAEELEPPPESGSSSILPSTQVSAHPQAYHQSPSCVGVKLSLRGKNYITTISHAWATRDEIGGRAKSKSKSKKFELGRTTEDGGVRVESAAVRNEKRKLESTRRQSESPAIPRCSTSFLRAGMHLFELLRQRCRHAVEKKILTPVGLTVYLEGSGICVGEISKTYDDLPRWHTAKYLNLFPMTFTHDLSLIEAKEGQLLPDLLCHPKLHPHFARPETSLQFEQQDKTKPKPKPAFVLHHESQHFDKCASGWKTGRLVLGSSKQALISGADYFFEGEHLARSLIWRTDMDDMGMSGSVLCLGNPTDSQAQALVFQNFQTPVSNIIYAARAEGTERYKGYSQLVTFKGGFFLPEEMLDHGVIQMEHEHDGSRTLSYNQERDETAPSLIPPSTSDPTN
ncbi:hypothetical protein B0H17DRAFT_1037822 [Mycena rosella]|uniref:Uncharacterized protein n=1 Tax=Mycena rosella TaxID=1033263 RepID=A0AAD7GU64_MYCRO|nr:hypothetical protein B0H17DRAFT_1037822 [Mycena rosella]